MKPNAKPDNRIRICDAVIVVEDDRDSATKIPA